ncbi:MAG: hypothetical protein M1611_01725 [Candidatus Marsarchaeota archaeon]|nr:hypothetical protein [Candidatus Marsarchaeota archaeon]
MGIEIGGRDDAATAFLGFTRKVAASDGAEHDVDETEERDLSYIIQDSCMQCSKPFTASMLKVLPPRYIQERDQYVRKGIVARRFMCVPCYNSFDSKARVKMKRAVTASTGRNAVVRSLLGGLLARH